MPLTERERAKVVKELLRRGWWKLEDLVPDAQGREELIWHVARKKLDDRGEFTQLLNDYYEPKYSKVALDHVTRIAPKIHDQHRGVRGWHLAVEWLLRTVAERDPEALIGYRQLPAMFRDFALIFLRHHGHLGEDEMTASAWRRLAQAWAATEWDAPWFDIKQAKSDDEWDELVLDVLDDDDFVGLEWARVEHLVERAEDRQKIALVERDESLHVREHAMLVLAETAPSILSPLEEALAKIRDVAGKAHNACALAAVLAVGYHKAKLPASRPVLEMLRFDLAQPIELDLEVTKKALEALDDDVREDLLLEVIKQEDDHQARAFSLAGVSRSLLVLDKIIELAGLAGSVQQPLVSALASFDEMAIAPLREHLGRKKISAMLRVTFIRALAHIGTPRVVDVLVEQTKARAKTVSAEASRALELLGDDVLEAAREMASSDGARIEAPPPPAKAAGATETPLDELEEVAEWVDDPDLDDVFAFYEHNDHHTSQDFERLLPFIDKHGPAVRMRMRNWLLADPDDSYRCYIWTELRNQTPPDEVAVWLAFDVFCKTGAPLSGWELDREIRDLDWLAHAHPKWAGRALAHYLGRTPPHADKLLEVLVTHAPKTDATVYLVQLRSSSKRIQLLAARGLAAFGDQYLDEVFKLLDSNKKSERMGAARALCELPTEGTVERLEEAIGKEKTADVRAQLGEALARARDAA